MGLSALATVAAWDWTAGQGRRLEDARFGLIVDQAVGEFRNRMEGYEQVLRSGTALLEIAGDIDRDGWRRFVEHVEVERFYPGTLAVGFAVRVNADQWLAHEARVRREGFADYAITPPGFRDIAYPIVFIEPFSGRNLRAFGYDMFSNPIRHEAMVRARDSGRPTLSGKVVLVQEGEHDVQAGVLLYMPTYGSTTPDTVEERRRAIRGFVYSPLRMGDMVAGVLGSRFGALCVTIFDGTPGDDSQLFASGGDCRAGQHVREERIVLFGRIWTLRLQSTRALDHSIAAKDSKLILGAGTLISVLLMWSLFVMLSERRQRLALHEALADLEQARREAAGAAATRGRFLATASHDLRQPMQSLGLFVHMLMESRTPGPVERGIKESYEATARLVEGMFDAAALDSGQARPALSRFDIGEMVERIAAENAALAAEHGLTLRHRVCHLEVETDRLMLERIVRNLISNAVKYTHRGGILVTCRRGKGAVALKVADSGPGIPEDMRERIFEDLYQIDNPERDPRKGLGLGLATVARLVNLLGYRLTVLSRTGLGSTFIIEIPLAR